MVKGRDRGGPVGSRVSAAAGGFFFYRHCRFSVGLCGLWVPDFSSLDLGPMDVAPPAPTLQRFTPLRDLSGELAADVLDLGRQVPGLPPILPFVLREIGGVAMAGNFRVRQVLIRPPLLTIHARETSFTAMAKSGLLGVGATAASSSVFPCDVARPSYRRHGPVRLVQSMDVIVPCSKGAWGRLSIQKVSDIHKVVVYVEKIVLLRQDLLCFFQRCWRLRMSISFLKPSLEHQLPAWRGEDGVTYPSGDLLSSMTRRRWPLLTHYISEQ
jgi:hypothetical protein